MVRRQKNIVLVKRAVPNIVILPKKVIKKVIKNHIVRKLAKEALR